jgi:hypothetical protein
MPSADELFNEQDFPPTFPRDQVSEETEALDAIQRRLESLQHPRVGLPSNAGHSDGAGRRRAMKINKIERNYIIFWGVVEVVAISPFYYLCYKIWKGWPNHE